MPCPIGTGVRSPPPGLVIQRRREGGEHAAAAPVAEPDCVGGPLSNRDSGNSDQEIRQTPCAEFYSEPEFGKHDNRVGGIEAIREELYAVMWDDVGIARNAEGAA